MRPRLQHWPLDSPALPLLALVFLALASPGCALYAPGDAITSTLLPAGPPITLPEPDPSSLMAGPAPLTAGPEDGLSTDPLAQAMALADQSLRLGLHALEGGDLQSADKAFDSALDVLLVTPNGQASPGTQGASATAGQPLGPRDRRLSFSEELAAWRHTLPRPAASLPTAEEPPEGQMEVETDTPGLVGPEDVQAVAEEPVEPEAVPEPDVAQHDVPIVWNNQVRTFIHYFQTRKWGLITRAFERASRYLPTMREIFREHGLPLDLLNLAFIESAFSPRALSRAKAAGIWQFMESTGRLYGLRKTRWLDERRDPEKATHAAAKYLKALYEMFGSWPLALAAYNAGEGKIQRRIERQRTRDFWALRLPRETSLFVPAFMAMTVIAKEPGRYGFSPPEEEPLRYETVMIRQPTDLKVIARAAGTSVEVIWDLNPELTRWATPLHLAEYEIRVPTGSRDRVLQYLAQLPKEERLTHREHRVRKGETVASIARRYGITIESLAELNGLRRHQPLRAGMVLSIPPAERTLAQRSPSADGASDRATVYRVKPGDTLSRIAKAFRVSEEDLERWNRLGDPDRLQVGQALRVPPRRSGAAEPGPQRRAISYRVKRGDTLATVARAFGVSTGDLARWNGLRDGARLKRGQRLRVLVTQAGAPPASARPKEAGRQAREVRYLVKPGDTLALIARRFAVPVEDLRLWNDLRDGAALRPGQALRIVTIMDL